MNGKITRQELSESLWTEIKSSSVILKGTANFAGTTGTVIPHNIGHTNYFVLIQPSQNAAGYLGEVWVEYAATSFKVCNTGSATTEFRYVVFK